MSNSPHLTDFQHTLIVYNWFLQADPLDTKIQEERKTWDALYMAAAWELTIVMQSLNSNPFSRFWAPLWSTSRFGEPEFTYFGMPVFEESTFQSSLWQVLKWGEEIHHTAHFEDSLNIHTAEISTANRVGRNKQLYDLLLTKVATWRTCSIRLLDEYAIVPQQIFERLAPSPVQKHGIEREQIANALIPRIQEYGSNWGYPDIDPETRRLIFPSNYLADRQAMFSTLRSLLDTLCEWEPFQVSLIPFDAGIMEPSKEDRYEPTDDPQRDGLVARTVHWGYRKKDSGVVRRKAVVCVYRFMATIYKSDPPD